MDSSTIALTDIPEKNYEHSGICSRHQLPMFPDGCVECKKELGLAMTKAQTRELTPEQLKNLDRTVPVAHFAYAGQEGSSGKLFLRAGREFTVSLDEPTTFNQAVDMVAREIAGLVIKKQMDYGHENIEAFGEQGIIVRLNDKMARLRNLIKSGKNPANEPIDDSYMDLAGYAFIALMLRRGWFKLDLE